MGQSAPEIVSNINVLTTNSQQLQAPANSVNILSGPLMMIGQGPFPPQQQVISGFAQIIQTAQADVQALAGTEIFKDKTDQQAIRDAFTTFVKVQQETLNILIGKAGILNDLPFVGPPIASIFRSLESVIDTLAFNLIDLTPYTAMDVTTQKNSWDGTISSAIGAYTPAV